MILCIVLMCVCILYAFSISYKNSGTKFYLIWDGLALFFLMCSVFTYKHIWNDIPLWIYVVCAILLLTGISILTVLLIRIVSHFHDVPDYSCDVLLILGAQYKVNGPSKALKYRLDEAYEYLTKNPDTICIVSGGQGYNEPMSEAKGMRLYLVNQGLDIHRILEEDRSTSTLENIVFSKPFIQNYQKVAIVTNSFHVYRAISIAHKQGIEAVGLAAHSTLWYQPNNVLRECFGIIKDTIAGNM